MNISLSHLLSLNTARSIYYGTYSSIREKTISISADNIDSRLSELWNDNNTKVLDTKNRKYAIISDLHIGNGGSTDKFKNNEEVVIRALDHYYRNDFALILLGDIEELWRFSLSEILKRYNDSVYRAIRKFGNSRVFRIYGNHDIDWKNIDPVRVYTNGDSLAQESIKLKDTKGRVKVLLIHGHQGTNDAERFSWLSRPFIKGYRYIEPVFDLFEPPSAPQSPIISSFEKRRYLWAKQNGVVIICGHTHRAVFRSRSKIDVLKNEIKRLRKKFVYPGSEVMKKNLISEITSREYEISKERFLGREFDSLDTNPLPCYFNTGCGLYKDGLTLLEIVDDRIKLVKWNKHNSEDQYRIYGESSLSDCIDELQDGHLF